MLSRLRAATRSAAGFTLIELLMSITILGIIGAAIASSLFVLLSTQQRTQAQLAVSQDRQLVATYFSDDAVSAQTVTTGSQPVCGSTMPTVVTLGGTDFDPGSTTPVATTVAYTYDSAATTVSRRTCRGASAPTTTVVARNVPTTPTVSGSCTSDASVAAPPPVELRLTVPQADGAPVVVCAVRRPQ